MGAEDDGGADASEEPPSASSMSNTFETSLSRSLSGLFICADETERADGAATSVELGDDKDEHPGDTDSGQEATTASSSADITMNIVPHDLFLKGKVIHNGDGVANVGAAARSEEGGVVRFGCPRKLPLRSVAMLRRRSVAMLAHAHRTMSRSSSKRGDNTEEDAVVDRANVSS